MSAFLGGGNMAASTVTYTGIPIQTSALGVCVPLVYGVCRVGCNLMWYGAFTQTGGNSKFGGSIVSKGNPSNGYTASVALGLCEGSINSLGTIWVNNGTTGIPGFGALFTGTYPQSSWGYLTTFFPGEDLPYPGIAYVGVQNMNLGSSAQLPSMNFEVRGLLCNSVTPISDADPSLAIADLLTDPRHGAGFPSAKLANLTSAGPLGNGSYQNYVVAQGLLMSAAYTSQQSAADMINDIALATNAAPVWNGTQLTFVPWGDQIVSGNGKTFDPTALLAPVWSFTNGTLGRDDFVPDQAGGTTAVTDPVAWSRKQPADQYNHIRLDYADVTNAYNNNNIQLKFQQLVDQFGLRTKPGAGASIFRHGNIAYLSASLQLQRERVMNTCAFGVDARFAWLDLMDVVQVPDPAGNLVKVRITAIDENDDDTFSIKAEELTPGMGTAVLNSFATSSGFGANTNAAPGSVNSSPLIFQPPSALIGAGNNELWFGASGSNPSWGGAQVWMSTDGGSTYGQIATITAPLRQGVLATTLPNFTGTNPDTTDAPVIDMSLSGGVLETVGSAAAASFVSLCLVDSELFSYASSVLVAANQDQITSLYRGLYSTAHAAHGVGAPFARLDGAVATFTLPASRYAGLTLHFKFPSFNIYGQQLQSLAACTDYTFTPV